MRQDRSDQPAGTSRPASSRSTRSIRAASSGLWVAISAASPVSRTSPSSRLEHPRPRSPGRGCRSARRRAAAAAGWRAPARTPPAAARRPRAPPAGAPAGAASPTASRSSRARAARRPARDAGRALRQRDVLERRELRQQVVELVDEADGVAPQPRARRVVERGAARPSSRTVPRVGGVEQPRDMQERRLARPRRRHQRRRPRRRRASGSRRRAPRPPPACRGCRPWRPPRARGPHS